MHQSWNINNRQCLRQQQWQCQHQYLSYMQSHSDDMKIDDTFSFFCFERISICLSICSVCKRLMLFHVYQSTHRMINIVAQFRWQFCRIKNSLNLCDETSERQKKDKDVTRFSYHLGNSSKLNFLWKQESSGPTTKNYFSEISFENTFIFSCMGFLVSIIEWLSVTWKGITSQSLYVTQGSVARRLLWLRQSKSCLCFIIPHFRFHIFLSLLVHSCLATIEFHFLFLFVIRSK